MIAERLPIPGLNSTRPHIRYVSLVSIYSKLDTAELMTHITRVKT